MRINIFLLIRGWPRHSGNKGSTLLLQVTDAPSLEDWCGRIAHTQGHEVAGVRSIVI
jgi:hypothetical protein